MGQLCRSRWVDWRWLTGKLDPSSAVFVSSAKWEIKITSNSLVCRGLWVMVTSGYTQYAHTNIHIYNTYEGITNSKKFKQVSTRLEVQDHTRTQTHKPHHHLFWLAYALHKPAKNAFHPQVYSLLLLSESFAVYSYQFYSECSLILYWTVWG